MKFAVTYEIYTPESVENGDAEERGYIAQGLGLREALRDLFETRTSLCEGVTGVEGNDSDPGAARWVTVYNGMEYETGAYESRSLHFPDHVTHASRARIARLVGAR